jgi:hypothetical protein
MLLWVLLLALPTARGAIAESWLPWEIWPDLRRLAVLPDSGQVLLRSSHCLDGCRKDRHSPDDPRFLRRDGKEGVIFEEAGAGAITRIWMTSSTGNGMSVPLDPKVRVRFYFDGEELPRIDRPLADLFSGLQPPFLPPLVGDRLTSSGGYFSYLPLAYRNGCRVTLEGAEDLFLWYQLTFHRLPLDRAPATYTGSEDLAGWRQWLASPGVDPWLSQPGYLPGPVSEGSVTIEPGQRIVLYSAQGAGLIDAFKLDLPPAAWSQLQLQLQFDGELTVDVPVADFFALGSVDVDDPAQLPTRSLLTGRDARGVLYSYFPMPFAAGAEVALENRGDQPVTVAYGVRRHAEGPLPGSGRFAIQLFDPAPSGGPEDLPLLTLEQPGKWVGLFAELGSADVVDTMYLEGDERLYLDGSFHPASYGTGTEDLFNAGFYFDQGPFGRALHGLQWRGERPGPVASEDASSAYRLMITDAVPFAAGLLAGLEPGPEGGLPMRARTVAYFYLGGAPELTRVDVLDLSDPASVAAHGYQPDGGAKSYELDGWFEGEPPRALAAEGVRRPAGSAAIFTLRGEGCRDGWRLRRRFDALHGGQASEVWVDGALAARLPYAVANPDRRWREIDVELTAPAGEVLSVEVRAAPLAKRKRLFRRRLTTDFTEFRYELWCRVDRRIFADGFESGDTSGWSQAAAPAAWPP